MCVKGRLLMLVALFVSAAGAVAAQSLAAPESSASPEAAAEATREREKKALEMLDDVVAEAQTLKLAENRIRVQMTAAALLWSRDEERARALFKEAQDGLIAFASAADPADQQYYAYVETHTQLRREMSGLLAARDPQAALNFLRATRRPPNVNAAQTQSTRVPDEEAMLEFNLIGQIASQDPKQALRMAEESLSKGLNGAIINVLYQLRTKDPEGARKLASAVVQKLRGADFSTDFEASNLVTSLLSMTRTSAPPAPSGNQASTTTTAGAQNAPGERGPVIAVDEQTRRDMIELAVTAVINAPSNRSHPLQGMMKVLQDQMAEVEKSVPTRVAPLRRRLAEFDRVIDPRAKMWRDNQNLMETGTPEALLEAAPKAPPEVRDALYGQAVWKTLNQGDPERARQLLNNISNPQQRAQMLREIERQSAWRAVEQGNFEEGRRAIERASSLEERVPMLLGLARTAASKEETKKAARQYLDEARSILGVRAENQILFSLKLQLAQGYATVEPARAFEVLEETIDHLNELVAAAAKLNGYGFDAFKDGELKPQGGYPWSGLAEQCANVLATLARTDLERAISSAQRLERTDMRVLVRLHLAHDVLEPQSSETPKMRNRAGMPMMLPMPRTATVDYD